MEKRTFLCQKYLEKRKKSVYYPIYILTEGDEMTRIHGAPAAVDIQLLPNITKKLTIPKKSAPFGTLSFGMLLSLFGKVGVDNPTE